MRQFGVAHIGAVFNVIGTHHLAVGRNDFRGEVGFGIFQFIESWHGAKQAYGNAKEEQNDQQEY